MNKFLTVSTLIFITSSLSSEDWPQWRGQDRDGTWKETGIVDSFPSDRLEPVWSTPVGSGYSGPTVSNGRVYLTSHLEEPAACATSMLRAVDRMTNSSS